MADVTARRRADGRRDAPDRAGSTDGTDRGQLFLIGALALAVLFIAVALLLNTAIYTENLATRSPGTDSAEVMEYHTAATDHATVAFDRANREHNTSNEAIYDNYTASVAAWDEMAGRHEAAGGGVATVEVTNTTNGTRIVQDDQRNFTAGGTGSVQGNESWVLVDDANARNYSMTVDDTSLNDSDPTSLSDDDVFHVNLTDSNDDVWSVYVYIGSDGGSDAVNVTVRENGVNDGHCSAALSETQIDLSSGTLAGQSCDALDFFADLDGEYQISYENAGQVEGTYSLVVDRDRTSIDDSPYYDDASGDSPYVTPALYAAELDLRYETPTAYYATDHRIAPGDPNE